MAIYAKIFLTITLCIVITMLLLSTVLYINFESIIQKQVFRYNMDSLAQTSQDASNMTETAKKLSYQIFQDLNISKLLYYSTPDVYDIGPAISQLGYYHLSMPFIESIYIYNGRTETFFITTNTGRKGEQQKSEFDDKDILKIVDNYKMYKPFQPIPREYTTGYPEQAGHSCYTFLYYAALASGDSLDSAVIVNISESWLHSVIDAGTKGFGGDTYILDNKGNLLSKSKNYSMLTNLSDRKYIKTILSDSSSGNFTDIVDGTKSLITFTAPDPLGWRYVRITPYNIVFSKVESMRKTTILLISIILVAGLYMAFLISRRLYIPIDNALSKLKILEIEQRNRLKVLKLEFLRNFLLGSEVYDAAAIQKKFDEHTIEITAANKTILALMRIDRYADFAQKYNLDDRNLFKFAIMNISMELASEFFKVEAVDMGDDRIVLLLNTSNAQKAPDDSSLTDLMKNIYTAVLTHLKISLSVTLSPAENSAERLNLMYSQAVEASYHRLFSGHGSILRSADILQYKLKEYSYPVNKEKLMVDALMTGKTGDAKNLYSEIVNETVSYPYTVINFVISHLVFTISTAVNIIQKNNALLGQWNFNISIISLNNVETMDEINNRFFQLFEEISKKLEKKKSLKYENLIQKINMFIDQEYMDPNLCLNSIAESLDMNPVYIGRLYKQHTLKTILDSVTEVRMNHAKQLLLETEFSVAEVAEKVGFTNSSYFYKTFKKESGVTPNDFRKNSKSMNC